MSEDVEKLVTHALLRPKWLSSKENTLIEFNYISSLLIEELNNYMREDDRQALIDKISNKLSISLPINPDILDFVEDNEIPPIEVFLALHSLWSFEERENFMHHVFEVEIYENSVLPLY